MQKNLSAISNRNVKKKKGFTLVELLVIIAILAIIAVIAIPAVAGLIEKANVSSDTTTVSEMTGALERWTTEYELYVNAKQSGSTTADQDVAQTRVEAVLNIIGSEELNKAKTGAKNVAELSVNEFRAFNQLMMGIDNATGTANGNNARLDTKSKLPTTARGFAAVVQNYTKLKGSSIFVPKQSQMSFYYNIDTGVVTFAPAGKAKGTDADLTKAVENNNALSGAVNTATGKIDATLARWIDVTATTMAKEKVADLSVISNVVVGKWTAGSVNSSDGTVKSTELAGEGTWKNVNLVCNTAPGTATPSTSSTPATSKT